MFLKFLDIDLRKRKMLSIEGDGQGEGEGAGGGTGVIEEGQVHHEEGEGQGGEQGKPQHVPYPRFAEVTRKNQELAKQLEAYKKFGDVESLAKTIARSKELSTGRRFTDSEVKALEDDLKQVPAIKQMLEFVESQTAERTEVSKQFVNDAATKVASLVKELGFDLKDPKDRQALEFDIQAVIAERIKQTPGWLARWKRNDISVVTEAWQKVRGIYGWTRRSNNAEIQAKKLQQNKLGSEGVAPNKDGKSGDGIPRTPEGKIDERAVLAQAADRGFARLKASEE